MDVAAQASAARVSVVIVDAFASKNSMATKHQMPEMLLVSK